MEAHVGIWSAIRNTPETPGITCFLCFKKLSDYELYNERITGEPVIVCSNCVENMIAARLENLKSERNSDGTP